MNKYDYTLDSIYTRSTKNDARAIARYNNYNRKAAEQVVVRRHTGTAKKVLTMIFLCIFVIFAAFLVSTSVVKATTITEDPAVATTVTYTTLEVDENTTLWSVIGASIPEEYSNKREYIEAIKEINNLSSTTICAGQSISIPCVTYNR